MPIQTREDRFANLAAAAVTESAVGTLTYQELLTGISIGAGIGMLIDQFTYVFGGTTIADIVAAASLVYAGWFTSNEPSSFNYNDRRLIDMLVLYPEPNIGTPASGGNPFRQPLYNVFSPPMVIASPRLFLGVLSSSVAAPASVASRIFFRYQPLTDKEYLELAETFVLVG